MSARGLSADSTLFQDEFDEDNEDFRPDSKAKKSKRFAFEHI